MKKFLLFILFCLSFIRVFSQLDREHWFAPMFDGQFNPGGHEQFLHLSTNETTPFKVSIYNNNTLIEERTISKGSPGVVEIAWDYMITDDYDVLNKVGTRGLYVKGEKMFFANLRFGVSNHAEIITSKGTAGLGTQFYTVMAPNTQVSLNNGSSASFIATEDNTTVTVNNFKKAVYFNSLGTVSSITFTFNRGESYIIDVRSSDWPDNTDGFIGATITSDKPISVTNGNFNGQYAGPSAQGSDILMDQSVPVDKLGNEFVVVKGYGHIGNNMEGAMVVATEKNTSVYLNDSSTPITTLADKGDYYLITENNYTDRGNDHYNLHIKTDKNVYIYQLLGGVEFGDTPLATGGMNYIPPLNCYLPRKIDEISYINYISDQPHFPDDFVTKLNIITQKGADVKVNGAVPDAVYGPYDISNITANQNWVTYSIPNVTGHITIESSKAVTAGIASGNKAFGYGGYFAGFSSIPLIIKIEGECLPGVKLGVIEGFDHYQWLLKVGNNYVPAPGINNQYIYEPSQSGIYAVKIQDGSCSEIQTPDYKFFNCTTYTNYDYDICSTVQITPVFALTSQSLDVSTVKITVPPAKGTATVAPDGKVTYTANDNATGTDTFRFSFCGIGTIPDCETIQATIHLNQIEHYDVTLTECATNGMATYDLTSAPVTPSAGVTKIFYENPDFTGQIPNSEVKNYVSAGGFVYVKMKNTFGCEATAIIELKSKPSPVITPSLYTKIHCDEDIDGILDEVYKLKVNDITPIVLQNPNYYTVRYYDTAPKANAGGTDNITGIYSFAAGASIWIRVDSPDTCPFSVKKISLKTGTKVPLLFPEISQEECDNDTVGSETLDLKQYISLFTNVSGATATYFNTLADAQNNKNPLSSTQTIPEKQTFYFRISASGYCDEIAVLHLSLKPIKKSDLLLDEYGICKNATIDLDAGPGFDGYLWSTNETSSMITAGTGDYWVDLLFDGCIYRQYVSVKEVDLPVIVSIEIIGTTVTVNVSGGNPPYHYSLDGIHYQDSNVFYNVPYGQNTVYVTSAELCDPVTAAFTVIRLLNVITPNGDGYNDVLDYSGLATKESVLLKIFDKYGALIFTGSKSNNYIWDGKISGRPVNTGSYWYVAQWRDPNTENFQQHSGWILVKNRN